MTSSSSEVESFLVDLGIDADSIDRVINEGFYTTLASLRSATLPGLCDIGISDQDARTILGAIGRPVSTLAGRREDRKRRAESLFASVPRRHAESFLGSAPSSLDAVAAADAVEPAPEPTDDAAEAATAADAAAADADGAAEAADADESLLGGAPRGRRSTDRRCGVAVGLALCVVLLIGALAFALTPRGSTLAGQLGLLGRAPPRPDARRARRASKPPPAANRTRPTRAARAAIHATTNRSTARRRPLASRFDDHR